MIRLFALLTVLLCAPILNAQEEPTPSTFHRLLIFNDSNEILVVKIKDRDLWVTPGWYLNQDSTIREGLTNLADSYALKIHELQLRGVFILRMGLDQKTSTRLIHSAVAFNEDYKLPDGIDQVKWLPVNQVLEVINLPHIQYQIKQIVAHPETVWGGTQKMHWEDGVNKFEVLEEFYPLFVASNGGE
ncbi:hypothetical protein [Kangiella koreensis]|uniref:NUDIX hydrolase n=1 Tax=Kangiella koreensis (strain DSM 16069 / JCM 12317 / KCTC 12182 / SW-125) TaxID=523791 RepID=C7RB13_KANKD|nr:hypothetical protein [Kangiella koreensis]ACV26455.1 hypothetical protein Kkor_1036 [Kangiella koreensis DSM 16069]